MKRAIYIGDSHYPEFRPNQFLNFGITGMIQELDNVYLFLPDGHDCGGNDMGYSLDKESVYIPNR